MTNNAVKIAEEIDTVVEGFARVPVVELPPHIKWGDDFLSWDDEKKMSYLMKFAEAMNHAADMIQKERDRMGELLEKKEKQITQMNTLIEANDRMLQSEITNMNAERQQWNAHAAQLNARIRELEKSLG